MPRCPLARWSAFVVFLACAAVAATGCPGGGGEGEGEAGEGEGEGEGGTTPIDTGCAVDEDCDAGEVCDRAPGEATGDCGPGYGCTDNPGACAFCGDTTLIPPIECGFGPDEPAYCSADAGVCRRQHFACEPCAADDECADSETGLPSVCAGGYCAPGCGGCPTGFQCAGGGCVPVGGSEVCDGSIACRDGTECPDGKTCTDLGVCLAVCTSDADCGTGDVCSDTPGLEGQCVSACTIGDTRLVDGNEEVCHADGHFRARCPTEGAATGCLAGEECDADGICQRTGCINDNDCPLIRTFCDVPSGACVDGCNDPSDCGSFELCDIVDGVGTCKTQGCRGKDLSCELGQWCCGEEAYADADSCPGDVEDGQCFFAPDPWCRACESDDDCADIPDGPYGHGFASYCYDLQDNDGQSIGKFCSTGCNENLDCPRGLQCVLELPTPNEGETTQGCLGTICQTIVLTH